VQEVKKPWGGTTRTGRHKKNPGGAGGQQAAKKNDNEKKQTENYVKTWGNKARNKNPKETTHVNKWCTGGLTNGRSKKGTLAPRKAGGTTHKKLTGGKKKKKLGGG